VGGYFADKLLRVVRRSMNKLIALLGYAFGCFISWLFWCAITYTGFWLAVKAELVTEPINLYLVALIALVVTLVVHFTH
jgi:hypothetical protein